MDGLILRHRHTIPADRWIDIVTQTYKALKRKGHLEAERRRVRQRGIQAGWHAEKQRQQTVEQKQNDNRCPFMFLLQSAKSKLSLILWLLLAVIVTVRAGMGWRWDTGSVPTAGILPTVGEKIPMLQASPDRCSFKLMLHHIEHLQTFNMCDI